MDQGRQRRDQVDALVVPDVRRQRGATSAPCARLQSRQFPTHAGDAGADQGLVADEPEGQADQDRREGRETRPLRRLPDGRGRHPTANVPADIAADRRTAAAATTSASVRRSMVVHSAATDRRSASKCQGKWPDQALNATWTALEGPKELSTPPFGLPSNPEIGTMHVGSGFIWGIPVQKILRLIAELRPQPPPALA